MKKLILAIAVLILFGSSLANAEQVYYCTSEIATGILKDKKTGEWKHNSFKPERLTIKFKNNYTKLAGLTFSVIWNCHRPFPLLSVTKNLLVCYNGDNNGKVFQFNKKNLRFLYADIATTGYLENRYDPNDISAGTCQKD